MMYIMKSENRLYQIRILLRAFERDKNSFSEEIRLLREEENILKGVDQ